MNNKFPNRIYYSFAYELKKYSSHNWEKKYFSKNGAMAAMSKHNLSNSKVFLSMDIKNFFNSIDHNILSCILKKIDANDTMIEVIISFYNEIINKKRGIYQGLSFSPMISNFYLLPLDILFIKNKKYLKCFKDFFKKEYENKDNIKDTVKFIFENRKYIEYTRYSDDILISTSVENEFILNSYKFAIDRLLRIFFKLEINVNKTKIKRISKNNNTIRILGLNIKQDQKKPLTLLSAPRKLRRDIIKEIEESRENKTKNKQKMNGLIAYEKNLLKMIEESNRQDKNELPTIKSDDKLLGQVLNREMNKQILNFNEDVFFDNKIKIKYAIKIKDKNENKQKLLMEQVIYLNSGISKFHIFVKDNGKWTFLYDSELIIKNKLGNDDEYKRNNISIEIYFEESTLNFFEYNNSFKLIIEEPLNKNIYGVILSLISELKWNSIYKKNYMKMTKKAFNNVDSIKKFCKCFNLNKDEVAGDFPKKNFYFKK